MNGKQCDGWVHSLRGQTICFTGGVFIDGKRLVRRECVERAEKRKAQCKEEFSGQITLVVHGDLAGKVVTDEKRKYSEKLVAADRERERGHHVCVVDADGFADLINGRGHPARCRTLKRFPGGSRQVLVLPETGDGVLGGPLRASQASRHQPGELSLDLAALDKGTEAHESTVAALIAHLARRKVQVCRPARRAPRFDAGWSRDKDVFIAEVKSLTGGREEQQIRLGIGQVLDYAHQMRVAGAHGQVRPVLVLERRPTDPRWASLAEHSGILLTWGPDFPGC